MKFNVIAQYHPAASLHRPRLWSTMLDDWENLPQKVDTSFIILDSLPSEIKEMALDTELENGLLGQWSVAFRGEDGKLYVVPYYGSRPAFRADTVIMHNAKWDLHVFDGNGMQRPKKTFDTMVAAYCIHPSTRVLTRNLRWIKCGQLKVGDELIGIDEHSVGRKRRAMRPTSVTHVSRRRAQCYKVTFSNGKEVIASDDHPWLTNMNRHKAAWRMTKDLKPGWRMMCPLTTWDTDVSYESGYLAGILDGEGSWSKWNMQIAQKPGLVLSYVEQLLAKRGVPYCRTTRDDGCVKLGISCTTNALPLLGSVRAERLIAKEKWNGVSPTRRTDPCVRVTSLEFMGEQEVVTLETDIHTFNAEGFWVHNCLGLGHQDPTADSRERGTDITGGLGLKYLARRHLGMKMRTWNEVKDTPEDMPEYNANDSVATWLLWEKWKPNLPEHFWTIDAPLLDVLMTMEDRGIAIDSEILANYDNYLSSAIAKYDFPFNPNSPPQLQKYIYETLGVIPYKFTDGGQPSVDVKVLETIDDPLIEQILEWKKLTKEQGTYTSNYVAGAVNGRVHPEFKQCRTSTGRLSSANPNLQNVPVGELRNLFIAEKGNSLICMDYSQLELRVFAAVTQDPIMLEAFEQGRDIHQETMSYLGIDRPTAKRLNFLMMYYGKEWEISRQFGISLAEAKSFRKRYLRAFPGVSLYFEDIINHVDQYREVTNYFGRKRRMDALYADDWRIRNRGYAESINTPIQGAAGEIVKLAMNELHYKHSAPILLQVHDELIFEVPKKTAKDYAQWLREYIPTITLINGVHFPVDVGIGQTWFEAEEDAEKNKKK